MSDDDPPLPIGNGSPNPQALADKAILGLCELLALLFGLPFGEDLYNDKPTTNGHIFYFIIALIFAGGGPMWPLIRTRTWLPESVSGKLTELASSSFTWFFVIVLLFIYGVAPEIYQRAVAPPAPPAIESSPSAAAIADAVISKMPKQSPTSTTTADDIAKAVVRQMPQIPDNIGSAAKIQQLLTDLSASNKTREDLTQQLNTLRSKSLTLSPVLGLDDAKRWQLFKAIRQASSTDSAGRPLDCRAIESIDNGHQLSVDLFAEIDELLYYAWHDRRQGVPPPPHQPFGIVFLVAGHSGEAFTCANHIAGILQNVVQVPVSVRVDQASDNLSQCNNECVEVRFGWER